MSDRRAQGIYKISERDSTLKKKGKRSHTGNLNDS